MPSEVKISFNLEGKCDRYCALTKMLMVNGYQVDDNVDFCSEAKYCQKASPDREPLGHQYR